MRGSQSGRSSGRKQVAERVGSTVNPDEYQPTALIDEQFLTLGRVVIVVASEGLLSNPIASPSKGAVPPMDTGLLASVTQNVIVLAS